MDIKEILKKLVSYNTIKDKQNKEIMDFIENYLKEYNFTIKRIGKCLIAYNSEKPNIGFIGHTDTVAYASWDGNPFTLEEKGSYLPFVLMVYNFVDFTNIVAMDTLIC